MSAGRRLRVLVADDEKNLRELIVRELTRKGHEAEGVEDGQAALDQVAAVTYDVLVLDMRMPRKAGIDVLRELANAPDAPQVIVMTGFEDVATAVEAMKLGAYDYLSKPTRIEELDVLVRKAAEKGQLVRDNVALRSRAPGAEPFGGIITTSPRMQDVIRVVDRVAPTDSTVLILGESGTGKELIARAIHERSGRAARPFVPLHCGAIPREVFESELFGHEKGAFTGAVASKPGLVELADGGTLFLDEIGEMEPDMQVKLLRALETGTFHAHGAVPPGPLLPHQHHHGVAAAAARSAGRHRAARAALRGHEHDVRGEAARRARPRGARELPVAGQRARAAARHRARGDPRQERRDRAG
jgi:DNA-binding NtrC family response regulator